MGAKSWLVLLALPIVWLVVRCTPTESERARPVDGLALAAHQDIAAVTVEPAPDRDLATPADPAEADPDPERVPQGSEGREAPVVAFQGHVRNRQTGAPIPGASVGIGESRVECDPHGRYEATAVLTGRLAFLTVRATGFAEVACVLSLHEPRRTELDFDLAPIERVSVRLVDSETGAPIVGAEVQAQGRPWAPVSDEGGFELEVGAGQYCVVLIRAAGYYPQRWDWVVPTGPLPTTRLALTRPAFVEGRVTDASGSPLPSVAVRSFGSSGPKQLPAPREAANATGVLVDDPLAADAPTDAEGRFRVRVRARTPGQRLFANRVGWAGAPSADLGSLLPGETTTVDLILAPTGTIRGEVRHNGRPVRGRGRVTWRYGDFSTGSTQVTSDGRFELAAVPSGRVELSLDELAATRVVPAGTVDVAAGQVVQYDFDWLEPTGTIAGRVTTPDGVPSKNVPVRAIETGEPDPLVATQLTDAAGEYRIEVPLGAAYEVRVERRGVRRRRDAVLPGATGVDFVVPELAQLRLQIVDAVTQRPPQVDGQHPFAVAWRVTGEPAFRIAENDIDTSGLLLLPVVAGTVDVQLAYQSAGYRPRSLPGLQVSAGKSMVELRVELQRGAELRLSLVGERPLPDAVRASHAWFVLEDSQQAAVRSVEAAQDGQGVERIHHTDLWLGEPGLKHQMPDFDAAGRATVRGLLPGRYRLRAFPDDLVFEPATFVVGSEGADVELRWRRR